jgi:hypothetical protein
MIATRSLDLGLGGGAGITHGVFLTALAEASTSPDPDEDLLVVLPLGGPWITSVWAATSNHRRSEAWPDRIRELAGSMTYEDPSGG